MPAHDDPTRSLTEPDPAPTRSLPPDDPTRSLPPDDPTRSHNPADDEQIISLILRYQELRDAGQAIDLDQLCPDPALRSLLHERLKVVGLFEGLAGQVPSPFGSSHSQPPPELPGYADLAEIARGGMGVVFKATQINLNRTVAIKMVLGHHAIDHKHLIRFLAEAEAVAAIDHPHVMRIYDTGSSGNAPYLAMEYLPGGTLAERIKKQGTLPPRQAADLIRKIALGVQAAHDCQIVHRDLKPANVMFDSAGEPKVTDFGLAKKAGGSDLTATQAIMGTPAYMAPEQAKGESKFVGPAADVWALGVMLFECLSGKRPFQGSNEIEILRKVAEEEASSVRSVSRTVPRDLELIVQKCLRKDASDRYGTAKGLADDLERFLAGKPVSVKAAGTVERTAKWVRRNKLAAGILAASLLAAVAMTGLAVWAVGESRRADGAADQARLAAEAAERQRQEAVRNLGFAKKSNQLLGSVFRGLDPDAQHGSIRDFREALLATLAKEVMNLEDSAIGDPLLMAELQNTLGSSLLALGQVRQAINLFENALATHTTQLGPDHPDTLSIMNNLADGYQFAGRLAEAEPLHQKALAILRKVLGEEHPATANSYNNLAANLNAQGKYAEAEPLYQNALAIRRKVLGEEHPHTAASYGNVAYNLNAQGKYAEAEPLHQKALAIRRKVLGEEHPSTAQSYNNVAYNLNAQGKYAKAEPLYQKALAINRKMLGEEHPVTANSYNNAAANLNAQGKSVEAEPLYQKALAIRRKVLGEEHPHTAASYDNVAYNLNAQGKYAEAEPLHQKALAIRRNVLGEEHPDTARSYNFVAVNLNAQGKSAEAEPLLQKALAIRRQVLGEEHPDTASSYNNVAHNQLALGHTGRAAELLEQALHAYDASRLVRAGGLDRALGGNINPRLLLATVQAAQQPRASWMHLEASLARGFLDEQAARLGDPRSPAEQAEETATRQQRDALQAQILFLVSKAQRTAEEQAQLDQLLAERRTLEEKLARFSTQLSNRLVAPPEAIQAAVPQHAAILMWVDVRDKFGKAQQHWACLVRRTGQPVWVKLPGSGPEQAWTKDDAALTQQIRALQAEKFPDAVRLTTLYDRLRTQRIAQVLPHMQGITTLYVAAVDEMAGIPVEVLAPEFTISYIPSGTFLAHLKERPAPASGGLLALGDPIFDHPLKQKIKQAKPLPPGGLLITQVVEDGAAAKARLQTGDVLLSYGGVELTDTDTLKEAISANASAQSVTVMVWRESEPKPFSREIPIGRLGVNLAPDPAPTAIANRRKTDAMLADARGGDWAELPGTRFEVQRLQALFGDQAAIHLDGNASEQTLDRIRRAGDLGKYRYLHFATHGEGNNVRAFESVLILSQDQLPEQPLPQPGEPFLNGQLSAREVMEYWKLNADLVTLSACETAIGKNSGGDGMLGFAQAFLLAGSRSVCLSLWRVDDCATVLLMQRFYENLIIRKMHKAVALHEAKAWLRNLSLDDVAELAANICNGVACGDRGPMEEFIPTSIAQVELKERSHNSKPFAEPRYWAAFILIGDPN